MRFYLCALLLLVSACQTQQEIKTTNEGSAPAIESAAAHWLTPELILVTPAFSEQPLALINGLNTKNKNKKFPLTKAKTPDWLAERFPHLANFQSYTVNIPLDKIKQLIKQPLTITQANKSTSVQTAELIDSLYTSGVNDANEVTDLGAKILTDKVQFKLWAPTALKVEVLLFDQNKQPLSPAKLTMQQDPNTGIWQTLGNKALANNYYRYQITLYHYASEQIKTLTVTDPYSLSLSTNSEYSQIIDLNAQSTMPEGWLTQRDNPVANPEDNIFYETHIRDFSAHDLTLANSNYRGKYLAFSEQNSDGIKHLKALHQAGINSIHLLPTFDIGTVNENPAQAVDSNDTLASICQKTAIAEICQLKNQQQSLASYLTSLPGSSEQQQALVSSLREHDNYNWGYDPFHYAVPEGSYALNPEGISRIKEFRTMVQALHKLGFRVIMDVVYNHTHQAALAPTSVLDKIVPGYYQRRDPLTGDIAQSTCCDNTATEHAMMEKLMIDSLVVWARDYKIDGFRFDLMAHQPKAAMLRARVAVQAIDSDNYFYGEGWNFGEVANNQRFVQASQLELGGTEIGTFSDRLRDAVRGGAFSAQGNDIRQSQGIGNGLATMPNELQDADSLASYYQFADLLRLGLAGNLANYSLLTANDQQTLGKNIAYGDQPAGYALDPADTINYVSKHDNQTLWDNNQYRFAYNLTTEQRVRMQLLSLSYVLFAQGIPFIHIGSELLRSKSFLRDSYDYGDWFNKLDFSMHSNNYNVGLPPAAKDQANWPLIKEVLKNNAGKDRVTQQDIEFSRDVFLDYLKLRMSSPLFRLTTSDDIINKVHFHNTGSKQQVGLIAMSISGNSETPSLMVLFNSNANEQTLTFSDAENYQLHPIQQQGHDQRVKQSAAGDNGFTVPALTTAIFIKKQD